MQSSNVSRRAARALINHTSPPYICPSCRHRSQLLPSIHSHQQQQHRNASSQNLPFTEKLRRKIWGTDNPPGLADPYGGPSFLERRKMKKDAERQAAAGVAEAEEDERRDAAFAPVEIETGREFQEEVQMEEYREAETWDGLQHVGHKGHWKDLPPQKGDEFQSWMQRNTARAVDRAELLSALHQSVVECLTCQKLGIDTNMACSLEPDTEMYEAVFSTTITFTADGRPEGLEGPVEFIEHVIHQQLQQYAAKSDGVDQPRKVPSRDADEESFDETEAVGHLNDPNVMDQEKEHDPNQSEQVVDKEEAVIHGNDPNAMDKPSGSDKTQTKASPVPAQFPEPFEALYYTIPSPDFLASKLDFSNPLTFSILKRFSQLSNHTLPDPLMNTIRQTSGTLSQLIDHLDALIQPKPKNLAEILLSKESLKENPNLVVLPRRETPVDKEKEVGRWKVIERELGRRGLPVLGRGL